MSRHIAASRIPFSPPFPFPIEKVGEVEVERWGGRERGRERFWERGKRRERVSSFGRRRTTIALVIVGNPHLNHQVGDSISGLY